MLMVVGVVLMFDVYLGYGLLIGGVLVMENSVIFYVVGVDIVCCMKLFVFDMLVEFLVKSFVCFEDVLEF